MSLLRGHRNGWSIEDANGTVTIRGRGRVDDNARWSITRWYGRITKVLAETTPALSRDRTGHEKYLMTAGRFGSHVSATLSLKRGPGMGISRIELA